MQRFTSTLRLRALPLRTTLPITSLRYTSTSSPKSAESASAQSGGSRSKSAAESASDSSSDNPGAMSDSLSDGDARGVTGGGKPLEASDHAPPQPKISNHSVAGNKAGEGLTKEQQAEVDEHNREFDEKHDRAAPAGDDKVDKGFWGKMDGGSKG